MDKSLRFAVWMLARKPGFAAVAAVTLVLGISVNTVLFSVIHALSLLSWPF